MVRRDEIEHPFQEATKSFLHVAPGHSESRSDRSYKQRPVRPQADIDRGGCHRIFTGRFDGVSHV